MKKTVVFFTFFWLAALPTFGQSAQEGPPQLNDGRESLSSLFDAGASSDIVFLFLALVACVWIIFALGAWQMARQEGRTATLGSTRSRPRSMPPDAAISRTIGEGRIRSYEYSLSAAGSPRDSAGKNQDVDSDRGSSPERVRD